MVSIWATLEVVLNRHEYELSKSDKSMRCVRVELEDGQRIVGVRYPTYLIPEVISMLESEKEMKVASSSQQNKDTKLEEKPAPINQKCREKALKPPLTILSFFQTATPCLGNKQDSEVMLPTNSIAKHTENPQGNVLLEADRSKKSTTIANKSIKRQPRPTFTTKKKPKHAKTSRATTNQVKCRTTNTTAASAAAADDDVLITGEIMRCPICDQLLPASFLAEDVNKHIDECLKSMEAL